MCELQTHDMWDQYTLAYGEGKNKYLYIKYGIKDDDRLLDFNTEDSGMYVDIRIYGDSGYSRLRGEKFNIVERNQYDIYCCVATDHEIYQKFGASCIIKVN